MILAEHIDSIIMEADEYTEPTTDFDVTVQRDGDSKFLQKVVGSFENEHGNQIECVIGFSKDYSVELGMSVDSESINQSRGLFKSLKTCAEFYKRFLKNLINMDPVHKVNMVYFSQTDSMGDSVHDTVLKSAIAPTIDAILGDEWEKKGRVVTTRNRSVFMWKRKDLGNDRFTVASRDVPGTDHSWYNSNLPDVSDRRKLKEPSQADRDQFKSQSDKIGQLKSRLYPKTESSALNRLGSKLYETLLSQFGYGD